MRRRIFRLFEARKSRLEYRVNRDYIRNGIARIPCSISDYNDVISNYSVKGIESLAPDFMDYLKSSAAVTPPEYPLVLDIIGDCLSEEQKKTIDFIVRDDLAYDLGMVEQEAKRHTRRFVFVTIGLILAGLLLWASQALDEVPREFVFILFWFMGDTLCDYIFMTGYDLRREKRLAGRLASIKVVFSDRFEEKDITKKDIDRLYSEIENDVHKTMEDDGKEWKE